VHRDREVPNPILINQSIKGSQLVKAEGKEESCSKKLMQQGNFIDVFLARHVSATYAHHQEH